MDVSQPVRAVIPSLEGPVLMLLSGSTTPLSLSEITRMADAGSTSGVRKALVRLTGQGVVDRVPGGYLLNREHLAASAVCELAALRSQFAQRLAAFADGLPEGPALMGLFGSYARRDGDSNSDIDVLLVTDSAAVADCAGELADHVRRWTGNSCHVVVLSTADVARMRAEREPILAEWRQDVVVVTGDIGVLGVPGESPRQG